MDFLSISLLGAQGKKKMFLATVLVIMVLLVDDPDFEKYEVFNKLELNVSWDPEREKLLKSNICH